MSALASEYFAVARKLDEARDRIAELEAEVAQLKQPASVLASAQRILTSHDVFNVWMDGDHNELSYWSEPDENGKPSREVDGDSLAEAYAKLTGGRDG